MIALLLPALLDPEAAAELIFFALLGGLVGFALGYVILKIAE